MLAWTDWGWVPLAQPFVLRATWKTCLRLPVAKLRLLHVRVSPDTEGCGVLRFVSAAYAKPGGSVTCRDGYTRGQGMWRARVGVCSVQEGLTDSSSRAGTRAKAKRSQARAIHTQTDREDAVSDRGLALFPSIGDLDREGGVPAHHDAAAGFDCDGGAGGRGQAQQLDEAQAQGHERELHESVVVCYVYVCVGGWAFRFGWRAITKQPTS